MISVSCMLLMKINHNRAMASKCVGEEEVGRIFAIFSLISATSSSLVYAAFQSIYRDLANSGRAYYFSIVLAQLLKTVAWQPLSKRIETTGQHLTHSWVPFLLLPQDSTW